MADDDFESVSEKWISLIEDRFDNKIAKAFKITLNEMFEDVDGFIDDLELGDWDDSAFMDELNQTASGFEDVNFCATFFKVLKAIVKGEITAQDEENVFLPKEVDWSACNDKKLVDEAAKFMNIQCPNAGFQDSGKNANLLKTIAVGRSNQIPLISMFIDMFELSHIDQVINNKEEFRTETEWVEKCYFFKNYKQNIKAKDIIRRAMTEFKHRLAGSGLQQIIVNKIQDDINIYIEYILEINNIIKNIIDSNKQICPLQIDVVILGKEHDKKNDISDEKTNYSDDDDDDDTALMAQINASMNDMSNAVLAN
eukprot:187136_1